MDSGLSHPAPQPDPSTPSRPLGPVEPPRHSQKGPPESQDLPEPVRPVGGPPAPLSPSPALDSPSRGLDQAVPTIPTLAQAPDIPLTGLASGIRSILKQSAPPAAGVLFECINRLQAIARTTQALNLYEDSIIASNLAGRLAVKTIEMTIGKDVRINATIHNQSHIPKWDSLPQQVRDRFLEAIRTAPQQATATLLSEPDEVEEAGDRVENDAESELH